MNVLEQCRLSSGQKKRANEQQMMLTLLLDRISIVLRERITTGDTGSTGSNQAGR
jgi:hypothetical protein